MTEEEIKEQKHKLNQISVIRIKESMMKGNLVKSMKIKNELNAIKENYVTGSHSKPIQKKWKLDRLNNNYEAYSDFTIASLVEINYKNIINEVEREILAVSKGKIISQEDYEFYMDYKKLSENN